MLAGSGIIEPLGEPWMAGGRCNRSDFGDGHAARGEAQQADSARPALFTTVRVVGSLRQAGHSAAEAQLSGLAAEDTRDPQTIMAGFVVLGAGTVVFGARLGRVAAPRSAGPWLVLGRRWRDDRYSGASEPPGSGSRAGSEQLPWPSSRPELPGRTRAGCSGSRSRFG